MSSTKIIVEGKTDSLFIRAFLKHHFNMDKPDSDFIKVDGCTIELLSENKVLDLIKKNSEKEEGINLLIFDADQTDFTTTKQNLESWKKELNINYEIFLFPNNKDKGNLETILLNIANLKNDKNKVLECFENYKSCITKLNKGFSLPDEHAKFFAFEEAVLSRTKYKDLCNKPDKYLEKEVYDIGSDYLNDLKDFLKSYF